MFRVLGRLASRFPWVIIAAWFVVGGALVAFTPSVSTTTDQADFLPHHYESIQATEILQKAVPAAAQSGGATIVFSRSGDAALTQGDLTKIDQVAASLDVGKKPLTALAAPVKGQDGHYFQVAPDGKSRAAIVNLNMADKVTGQNPSEFNQIKDLRDKLATAVQGSDLKVGVTGTLAQTYDQSQSGSSAEAIVGIATVGLIILLLSLIFRSGPITALPVVLIAAILTPVSNALINYAADWFNLQKDDSTSVIMIVVLFGVGTDYVLFYLFRYRERIRQGAQHGEAIEFALERAGEAIVSAGGAVFVAFMTLVLSSLGIFKSIGPSLAIGVGVTLIAAITLVPAVVSIMGPLVLWPSKDYQQVRSQFTPRNRTLRIVSLVFFVVIFSPLVILAGFLGVLLWTAGWPSWNRRAKIAAMKESFAKRPVVSVFAVLGLILSLVAVVIGLLVGLVCWPFTLLRRNKAASDPDRSAFARIGTSLAAKPVRYALASGGALVVLAVFALGFNPTFDLGSSQSAANNPSASATATMEAKGFSAGATEPTPVVLRSTAPISQADLDSFASSLKSVKGVGSVAGALIAPGDPKVAIVSLILDADPTSQAAIDIVKQDLRPAVQANAPNGTQAYVGGTASIFVDFQAAMNRDYKVVFPVAAAIILIILMLLLRSLVAPWYLMISVGLGFAATLGSTVIVFQHLKGDHGLIFLLPIYIYLFVVALGTDYNILMVSRLREEAREGKEPRQAAAWAVRHAGPTIAAAGLILAGTFASLMLAGNSLMLTMGFAISFGIVVAAFVMAMFFTPALTALVGHAAWWPGHGDEARAE